MDIKERACLTKATLSESVPQADLAVVQPQDGDQLRRHAADLENGDAASSPERKPQYPSARAGFKKSIANHRQTRQAGGLTAKVELKGRGNPGYRSIARGEPSRGERTDRARTQPALPPLQGSPAPFPITQGSNLPAHSHLRCFVSVQVQRPGLPLLRPVGAKCRASENCNPLQTANVVGQLHAGEPTRPSLISRLLDHSGPSGYLLFPVNKCGVLSLNPLPTGSTNQACAQ